MQQPPNRPPGGYGPPGPQYPPQGYANPQHPPQGYAQPQPPQQQGYAQPQHGYAPPSPPGYPQHPQQGYAHPQHPQHGYAPPQQAPQQQGFAHPQPQRPPGGAMQPMQGPPGAMAPQTPAPTVRGLALEPGERVIYYEPVSRVGNYVQGIFLGLLFTPLLFGLYFLYKTVTLQSHAHFTELATNRRIVLLNGFQKVLQELRWEDITGYTRVMNRGHLSYLKVNTHGDKSLDLEGRIHTLVEQLPKWQASPQLRDQAPIPAYPAA